MRINELATVLRSAFASVQMVRLWSLQDGYIDVGSAEYIVKEHGWRKINRLEAENNYIVIITD